MDEKKTLVYGLGKQHKVLTEIPKRDEPREHLRGLLIKKSGFVEGTDTHLLVRAPLNEIDKEDLPAALHVEELGRDIWVSVETLRHAFRNLSTKPTLEALKNLYVKNGKDVAFVSSDLDRVAEVKESPETAKKNLKDYPVTDRVLALDEGKVQYRMTFSAGVLKKLLTILDAMSENADKSLTFLFTGETSPAYLVYTVDGGRKGIAVAMPTKNSVTMAESVKEFQAIAEQSRSKEAKVAPPVEKGTLPPEGKQGQAQGTTNKERTESPAPVESPREPVLVD